MQLVLSHWHLLWWWKMKYLTWFVLYLKRKDVWAHLGILNLSFAKYYYQVQVVQKRRNQWEKNYLYTGTKLYLIQFCNYYLQHTACSQLRYHVFVAQHILIGSWLFWTPYAVYLFLKLLCFRNHFQHLLEIPGFWKSSRKQEAGSRESYPLRGSCENGVDCGVLRGTAGQTVILRNHPSILTLLHGDHRWRRAKSDRLLQLHLHSKH